MRIIGIDPGKTGWWCLLDTETREARAKPIRWTDGGIVILDFPNDIDAVYLEKIHVNSKFMPSSSSFNFGKSIGQIEYATKDYAVVQVAPKTWQKQCLIGIDEKIENKMRSRAGFSRLNPEHKDLKLSHDFTDSFHIACFGVYRCGHNAIGGWKWTEIGAKFKT